jgi:hypothetical protein
MEITPEIVRELLHYDPETGIFTWRRRDRKWFATGRGWSKWNTRYAGKAAGSIATRKSTGYQYRRIGIFDRDYIAHRLAWLYMVGDPIPEQIDHRNRDATDNRWENIRASDALANMHNQSRNKRNTSGASGVSWHAQGRKWCARCSLGGKYHHLGLFKDIEEASAAVQEFRLANGFDPAHGAEPAHYHA